jgi:hypothetical protein
VVDHPVSTWAAVRAWAVGRFGFIAVAVGLAVVLGSVIVFGPISGRGGTATVTPSQSPAASEMAAGSQPAGTGGSGSASPATESSATPIAPAGTESSATPIAPAGTSRAHVLATGDCPGFDGQRRPVVSGNTIYAICASNPLTAIRAIDATTGRTIATYEITDPPGQIAAALAVDSGLWYSTGRAGACVEGSCPTLISRVTRLDLASRQVTFSLDGYLLAGDGLGYVWASPYSTSQTLMKIDPVTLKTSTIPWHYGAVEIACGSLWGLNLSGTWPDPQSTTITRVDPATGSVLATFTEPGVVSGLQQTPAGCWAVDYLGAKAGPDGGQTHSHRYLNVGSSSIESRSPVFAGSAGNSSLTILDGTFWINWTEGEFNLLQRLDPASWQRVGPAWVLPEYWCSVIAAGGAIWVQRDLTLERLDIPLGA